MPYVSRGLFEVKSVLCDLFFLSSRFFFLFQPFGSTPCSVLLWFLQLSFDVPNFSPLFSFFFWELTFFFADFFLGGTALTHKKISPSSFVPPLSFFGIFEALSIQSPPRSGSWAGVVGEVMCREAPSAILAPRIGECDSSVHDDISFSEHRQIPIFMIMTFSSRSQTLGLFCFGPFPCSVLLAKLIPVYVTPQDRSRDDVH